ncbi:MAG: hypothetical protein WA828_18530 [Coleofasciculaceae cyanobacterium]
MRRLLSFLMAAVLALSLAACGDNSKTEPKSQSQKALFQISGSLSEVAPPPVIRQLGQSLAIYQPQVSIVSPQAEQVLQDTTVTVELMVQDLPIFQDPTLEMGPHLEVILDNKPYTMVYDLKQPLVFSDLEPGTHTLRVLAATPWHESFKNDGAYAQTTFHIFTKTTDNNPDSALPLLTYSRPTGSYGAEPIMLDFYLTNAPLHLVAQENPEDAIADWRIRATVNGQSFILDRWQSVYLKGFKPGKNWVQLEFLDEQGNPVKNVFNNTVRLIDYQPKGKDALSKLIRGEISAVAARGIVEPGYENQPVPTPEAAPDEITPDDEVIPIDEIPTPEVAPDEITPDEIPIQPALPEIEATPTETKPNEPKSGGFFGRFRRQPETPKPSPEVIVPEEPLTPEPEVIQTPEQVPTPEEELPASSESIPQELETQKSKPGGFFGRFRRATEAPQSSPQLPIEVVPSPEPTTLPEIISPEPTTLPEIISPETEERTEQPPEVVPEPVLIEKAPIPEILETPQPNEEAAPNPKDLKEVFLTPPVAPTRIILAPTEPEIPQRFLKKSASEPIPEASELPATDSEPLTAPETTLN